MVMITSDPAVSSPISVTGLACSSASSSMAAVLMSLTSRRKPLRHRLDAIGRPMRPSPINPTFMHISPVTGVRWRGALGLGR